MSSSSESGVSDTLDPVAIVSDDEILPEDEVFTSDTTSSDDDDFQPFALPDFEDDLPLADGFLVGDLPLAQIRAPIPLAALPVEDLPLDDMSDDDIDLFIEGPPEDDQDGGAPIDDDVAIPFEAPVVDASVFPVEAPVVEALSDQSGPDSFESLSSSTLHALGLQRYPTDTDSDTAMSAAPDSPQDFEFGDEFDPDLSDDFDPDHEIEFIPEEQPDEAPLPHDPLPVHSPILVDVPVVAPPVVGVPVVAPPVVDVPVVAPLPNPIPVFIDRAPFATHVDPIYAHTRNGWIEDDDDYSPFVRPVTPRLVPVQLPVDVPQFHPHVSDVHRMDLPVTFLQDIPPPRPGEGPSSQQHDHIPPVSTAYPFMPPFAPATHTAFPLHPWLQQDMLSRRVTELERIPHPLPFADLSQPAFPHASLFPYPDFGIRFLTMEQKIACLLRIVHALEEDLIVDDSDKGEKMPPRRENRLPTTEAELQARISQAIADYEASRAETSGNTSRNNPPNGCTFKQFLDCKPLNFDGTGGAVAYVRWTEKTDSVQTLGEAATYALTWTELNELMRKKYCSRAEIQKLETEFWNLKMDSPKIAEYV
ncbi:uncharacterized protein LOC110893797 [Helianthus annuus]|uniref:uncharacterized protein LOC110893797 n=1 Tax=Helianthus annuus TaxID=4232 RepID=UPI000B8FD5F6|nr:uncharacterized protein LOC110893797 [Helianthus annuus]